LLLPGSVLEPDSLVLHSLTAFSGSPTPMMMVNKR
jgi:hypothetical protein